VSSAPWAVGSGEQFSLTQCAALLLMLVAPLSFTLASQSRRARGQAGCDAALVRSTLLRRGKGIDEATRVEQKLMAIFTSHGSRVFARVALDVLAQDGMDASWTVEPWLTVRGVACPGFEHPVEGIRMRYCLLLNHPLHSAWIERRQDTQGSKHHYRHEYP
jgi:hypothetical protein